MVFYWFGRPILSVPKNPFVRQPLRQRPAVFDNPLRSLFGLFQVFASRQRQAVALLAATRLVWDGHFDQARVQGWQ